jgi:copper oxidase (laccase) domain-containing protein
MKKNTLLDQVHGRDVLAVDERPENSSYTYGTADAMVTSLPGLCLVIRTADWYRYLWWTKNGGP